MKRFTFLFFFCLALKGWGADIIVVHAFDGFLKEQFADIVQMFNVQSEKTRVVLSQAKNYKEAYENGIIHIARSKIGNVSRRSSKFLFGASRHCREAVARVRIGIVRISRRR